MNVKSLIEKFDRVSLAFLPTPLEYAENLTKLLGGPKIFFKRDDCTGLAFGGNKARKLEFIMADALKKKADVIITTGGPQSNWARQTAAAAKKLGMEVILVLEGNEPQECQGNLLLDHIMGCDIRFEKMTQEEEDKEIQGECPITGKVAEEVKKDNKVPYLASLGAATPLGNLGYINAVDELKDQLDEMGIEANYVALATGTGGTQAGVEIGVKLLGLKTKVLGLSVSRHTREKADEISELCNKTINFLQLENYHFTPDEITVNYDYIGEGYAIPTDECIEAVRTVAQTEGIILDPVYTGKAMAGLIDLIKKDKFKKDENIVFIHTGGGPANFGYHKIFSYCQN